MEKYMIALDQGTTSSRCILFDHGGRIAGVAQKEFSQIFPNPGWVEHDPEEIWQSIQDVMAEAMGKAHVTAENIAGIGITNQRETTVVWDKKTGKPIYNAIVWQCRRTAPIIEDLKAKGYEAFIKKTTGLIPDAYFSGTKIKWILDHVEDARERAKKGELLFGTIDTWLIWNLSGGRIHVTDYTNASRTMLFDIHSLCWNERLLEVLDIPMTMMPEVKSSSCIYGYTDPDVTGGTIAISGAAGDQQAALFGQCCFQPGDVKATYGTGCFLLMNTGDKRVFSKGGLLPTVAWKLPDYGTTYALDGGVYTAGTAISWLQDELRLFEQPEETEQMAKSVADTGGVFFVPAFSGLGAPHWDQYARGTIVGLTRGVNKYHIIRATLESIAYQVNDVLTLMKEEADMKMASLKVDGGTSANNFLMQSQADISDAAVERPRCIETTAMGAAYLAGLAVGYWPSVEDIKKNWTAVKTFLPAIDEEERERRLAGWKRAVRITCGWSGEES